MQDLQVPEVDAKDEKIASLEAVCASIKAGVENVIDFIEANGCPRRNSELYPTEGAMLQRTLDNALTELQKIKISAAFKVLCRDKLPVDTNLKWYSVSFFDSENESWDNEYYRCIRKPTMQELAAFADVDFDPEGGDGGEGNIIVSECSVDVYFPVIPVSTFDGVANDS